MDSNARRTERKFNLPHGTCQAFALQESHYDWQATRVEMSYYNDGTRYWRKIAEDSRAYLDTAHYPMPLSIERSQRAESTGLFQIMGENLRILGFERQYIELTLAEQFEYFGRYIAPLFARWHSLAIVASVYNSGSSKNRAGSYAKHIVAYQRKFYYK
jgi:hypothetical protein